MNRRHLILGAFAALCLAMTACSDGPDAQGTRYELRLKGTRAQRFDAAYTSIRSVAVTVGGQPLHTQLQPTARAMDLAAEDHAYLVAYFWVPKGQEGAPVEVRAQFDEFGAYRTHGDVSGAIDTASAPIRFNAPAAQLDLHGHAVMELDVDRSLIVGKRDVMTLLPAAVIAY